MWNKVVLMSDDESAQDRSKLQEYLIHQSRFNYKLKSFFYPSFIRTKIDCLKPHFCKINDRFSDSWRGLAGCTLASRLKEYKPSASVILVEAGPNEHENQIITNPMGTSQLRESQYEYNYRTVPQKHYDGRAVFNTGGRVPSGSSSVNYALWSRGRADNYNLRSKNCR
jgi:hypothetical protein